MCVQVPVEVTGEGVPLMVALAEPPPHRVVAFGAVARGASATRTVKVRSLAGVLSLSSAAPLNTCRAFCARIISVHLLKSVDADMLCTSWSLLRTVSLHTSKHGNV